MIVGTGDQFLYHLNPTHQVSAMLEQFCVIRLSTLPSNPIQQSKNLVDNPKPGVCVVLESCLITETVASGSDDTTMEQRVIVRLCNLSSNKTTLLKGACLGLLVETYPDESLLELLGQYARQ